MIRAWWLGLRAAVPESGVIMEEVVVRGKGAFTIARLVEHAREVARERAAAGDHDTAITVEALCEAIEVLTGRSEDPEQLIDVWQRMVPAHAPTRPVEVHTRDEYL